VSQRSFVSIAGLHASYSPTDCAHYGRTQHHLLCRPIAVPTVIAGEYQAALLVTLAIADLVGHAPEHDTFIAQGRRVQLDEQQIERYVVATGNVLCQNPCAQT
jgi:hypothetical protein